MIGYENQPVPREEEDCAVLVPHMIKALMNGERIGLQHDPRSRPVKYNLEDYIRGVSEKCDKELVTLFMAPTIEPMIALHDRMKQALEEECRNDADAHAAYLRKFGINS